MKQPLFPWLLVALLNFAGQIILSRELLPGEFGTFNALVALVGLLAVPALALPQVLEASESGTRVASVELLGAVWGVVAVPLLFLSIPVFELPRFSLVLFALLILLLTLAGIGAGTHMEQSAGVRRWAWVLVAMALVRAAGGAFLGWITPHAEAGLAAMMVVAFLLCLPALRVRGQEAAAAWKLAWRSLKGDFWRRWAWLAFVTLGLFLFASGDRIFALTNFGVPDEQHIYYYDPALFDGYEAAGLLGRALLWGTQPLLVAFYLERARLDRTTVASLRYFWIYLAVLLTGAFLLGSTGQPLCELFVGDDRFAATWRYLPAFALAMVPIGVLQAFGTFALASRRGPEGLVLGGCGLAYALVLYFTGTQPPLMLAYMFGGAVISMMAVLFVGVVRWGRRQP